MLFLLLHLRLQRLELRGCGIVRCYGFIQILFADHAGLIELAGPLKLLLRVLQVGLLRLARCLLAAGGRLLL